MPFGLLDRISRDLLVSKIRLDYIIRSSPHRYKTYEIKKRSGNGKRLIAQPAREVKSLQYWVIKNILSEYPVHECATAYVKNRNIYYNATMHVKNDFILKLDFENFFPSIKSKDFEIFIGKYNKLSMDESDVKRLTQILFWTPKNKASLQLSIGAPSSPMLSNIIMYDFDCCVTDFCDKNNIIYTRYADDMTFSSNKGEVRDSIVDFIKKLNNKIEFPRLRINKNKTVYSSRKNRRAVTGLILSNEKNVSLGRAKKRILRAKVHYYIQGRLKEKEIISLAGLLAFARDVDPLFVCRLEKKYGKKAIDEIHKKER